MKRSAVALGVILLLLVMLGGSLVSTYNSLVRLSESTDNAWAEVQNQLQRRYDLIPNLVETVKGFASQEKEVLGRIADARASWQSARASGSVEQQVAAANQAEGALSRLLVIVENYPTLRSSEQFTGLRDELAGTENRLAVARNRYNEQVRQYNQTVKSFPTVIVARLFGYHERIYFETSGEAANQPPKVDFSK